MKKVIFSELKETTVVEATDGKTFKSPEEAIKHQLSLDFERWYSDDNELFCAMREVDPEELYKWLAENRSVLQQFFSLAFDTD